MSCKISQPIKHQPNMDFYIFFYYGFIVLVRLEWLDYVSFHTELWYIDRQSVPIMRWGCSTCAECDTEYKT